MSIKQHLADIDFRTHAERQGNAKEDFVSWYHELNERIKIHGYTDLLRGQKTMLSSVLWYILDPKEYKALVQGKEYIDVERLFPDQKKLYRSLMGWAQNYKWDYKDKKSILDDYKLIKPAMAELVDKYKELSIKIAHNILASKEKPV